MAKLTKQEKELKFLNELKTVLDKYGAEIQIAQPESDNPHIVYSIDGIGCGYDSFSRGIAGNFKLSSIPYGTSDSYVSGADIQLVISKLNKEFKEKD